MEVSKLEISDELKYQTSPLTKILLWMKAHPEKCKNTSTMGLAKTIGLDKDRPLRNTTGSIDQYIRRLIRKGLVIRNGGLRRADYKINYGHPDMPPIVEGEEVKTTTLKRKSDKNARQEGKRMFEKVQKAEKNGLLKDIKNRRELALLAGFTEEETKGNKRGYSWVSNLIHRGHIEEKYLNGDPSRAYYKILDTPDYSNWHVKKPKAKKQEEKNTDMDYEVLKENKTPEEQATITKMWFNEHGYFEPSIANDWSYNKEEKEKKMEDQNVNLPDGKTITLTININFGK